MRIAVAGGTGLCGALTVSAARAAGHDVVVISRANGVDLLTGMGLAEALAGVDVVIDAANIATTNGARATAFFEAVAGRLQRTGALVGVRHVVVLSIVGIDRASGFGYYAAKLRQEHVAKSGSIPATIVRSTQFHEFPAQIVARAAVAGVCAVPIMRTQPVAARSVADVLVEVAQEPPHDVVLEVGGPRPEQLVGLARRIIRHRGRRIAVVPVPLPGDVGRAFRGGAMLPTGDARIVGGTFDEWLSTSDSAAPAF